MRNVERVLCLVAALLALPTPASAQRAGEIVLFAGSNYQGLSFTVRGARETLGIPWPVRSVRVPRGETWELCTRSQFRTPCNRVSEDTTNLNWIVASARPAPRPPAPAPGREQSLRGMSSEFFVAPRDARGRIQSCASGAAACARDSADRFCRQRGWTAATYHRQETVNRVNYLTDILCTRTGR